MKVALLILSCAAAAMPSLLSAADQTTVESIIQTVESVTGWTSEELKAGLDRLDILYQNDMQTNEGRKRWHGKVISTVFNTNALTKVETHEDGFIHTEGFKPVRPPSIRQQLSAAERKKLSEEAKARRLAALVAKEKAKLAELMAKYPAELARIMLENEKAALQPEVEVSSVIEPQK